MKRAGVGAGASVMAGIGIGSEPGSAAVCVLGVTHAGDRPRWVGRKAGSAEVSLDTGGSMEAALCSGQVRKRL